MKIKNLTKTFITTTWALTALLVQLETAVAYNARWVVDAPIRWHSDTNTVGFKFQGLSLPPGSPSRAAITSALRVFNLNSSLIRGKINPDDDWVSVGNGQNEIWFTDNQLVLDGAPAITITHFNPFAFGVWNLMEADIVFDPAQPWTASRLKSQHQNYGGGLRPLRATALHEIGHAFGMQHENRVYNIMGTDWDHITVNGPFFRPSLGEDTSLGLIRIYGVNPSAPPDVGIGHSKYLGTSGEYSTHQRTLLFNMSGTEADFIDEIPGGPDPGQKIYLVSPGEVVSHEFTYENNGPSTVTVTSRTVLSTNSLITTMDREIGSENIALPPDDLMTHQFLVTIPSDVTSGQRLYIGVIVDADNTLSEATETNNASFIPVQVR